MKRLLMAAAIVLATPTAAIAHPNGWNTWVEYKAAHPLEDEVALSPGTARDYARAEQRLRERWQEFDATYWESIPEPEPVVEETAVETAVMTGGASLCDAACIECESTWNPQAVSPDGIYWGLYQYDYPSWIADGGSPECYGVCGAAIQHGVAANAPGDRWPNC